MQIADAEVIETMTPFRRIAVRIAEGEHQGIIFHLDERDTLRLESRLGECVRVRFHPEDQFARFVRTR